MNSVELFTEVGDIVYGLIKAMFFGGIIALIACYEACTPRAAQRRRPGDDKVCRHLYYFYLYM